MTERKEIVAVPEDSMAEMNVKLSREQYWLVSFEVLTSFNIREDSTSGVDWDSVTTRHTFLVIMDVKEYIPANHHKRLVSICYDEFFKENIRMDAAYHAMWNMVDFEANRYSDTIVNYVGPEEEGDQRKTIQLSKFVITQVHQKSPFIAHYQTIKI